jgi:hypothetical protein
VGRRKRTNVAVQAVLAGKHVEGLGELIDGSAAAATTLEVCFVELAASGLADERLDLSCAVGVDRAFEPVEEEVFELVGQALRRPLRGCGEARSR